MSSVSAGPSLVYRYHWNSRGDANLVGHTVPLGLFGDKVRFSYGRHDVDSNWRGQNEFWHVGSNDLDGMLHWL